jgi:hypothetical protein
MIKHTPLGRLGEGTDIAAALYLVSPASAWVSGQVLTVSGGGVQELDSPQNSDRSTFSRSPRSSRLIHLHSSG